MTLLYYESVFSGLNLHMAGARVSPHKVAMLLAVTDLVEDGTLTDNRIEYSKSLTAAFQERFRELGTEGDSSRAIYPYFHLRKDGFWHHWLKPGQSESYYQLSTVTNRNQIDRHIAFAYLAGRKRDMEYISTVHDVDPPPYTGNWDRVLDPDLPEHVAMALPPKRRYLARHVNYSVVGPSAFRVPLARQAQEVVSLRDARACDQYASRASLASRDGLLEADGCVRELLLARTERARDSRHGCAEELRDVLARRLRVRLRDLSEDGQRGPRFLAAVNSPPCAPCMSVFPRLLLSFRRIRCVRALAFGFAHRVDILWNVLSRAGGEQWSTTSTAGPGVPCIPARSSGSAVLRAYAWCATRPRVPEGALEATLSGTP